ncbi:MAG TPA: hypothetical protein VFJ02_19535 [Vicinamibacterales bacterium]|nr:hypothetical protein [Vicinamibacterales bacterium]
MRTSFGRHGGGSARKIAAGMCAAAITLCTALPLSAQRQQSQQAQPNPPGWVFTPGISVAETFDSNVLLSGEGDDITSDFLTAVTPRGALTYRGRQTTFSLDYRGSYQLYQELSALNAFDQRAMLSAEHRLSPYVSLFVRNSLSKTPTTDELDIPGVVFRRQGVLMDDFSAGVDARFSKRSSLRAAYVFQWLRFDGMSEAQAADALRRGGYANGGRAEYSYRLNPRVSVGAEFEGRRANVDVTRDFDVQNLLGTVDVQLSPRFSFSGAAGYSWLGTDTGPERRSAPAFRVNLSRSGQRLGWSVGYRKSFLPSFGFGGTFQNQEFEASFIAPLTRRLDLSGNLSIRDSDPLASELPGLRSLWVRSTVSYLATRWMRIEGFYAAALQDARRAGGQIDRSRLGVQVVTSTRMRVR